MSKDPFLSGQAGEPPPKDYSDYGKWEEGRRHQWEEGRRHQEWLNDLHKGGPAPSGEAAIGFGVIFAIFAALQFAEYLWDNNIEVVKSIVAILAISIVFCIGVWRNRYKADFNIWFLVAMAAVCSISWVFVIFVANKGADLCSSCSEELLIVGAVFAVFLTTTGVTSAISMVFPPKRKAIFSPLGVSGSFLIGVWPFYFGGALLLIDRGFEAVQFFYERVSLILNETPEAIVGVSLTTIGIVVIGFLLLFLAHRSAR